METSVLVGFLIGLLVGVGIGIVAMFLTVNNWNKEKS
jgi:uncharacterized membrane-anchored protein YhcB (DUF1043 family)